MKKLLIILYVLITSFTSYSQTLEGEYLNPTGDDGDPYKWIRFGNTSNYWGGFLWNNNSTYYGNGNDFSIFTYGDRDITLCPGYGNISLTTDSKGFVGIGVSNPNHKLDVHGKTAFRGLNPGSLSITEDLISILIGSNQTRNGTIGSYNSGIGFNHLLTHGGNINGVWKNQLHAWIGTRLISKVDSELAALVFATTTNTGGYHEQTPTEKMVILPNGNVGIGSKSPSSLLELNKESGLLQLKMKRGQKEVLSIGSGSSSTGEHGIIQLFHNDSESIRLYTTGNSWINSGNLGIGTTDPNFKLEIISPNSGINIVGANSRIYFNGNRAIEGAQDHSSLDFGEGYTNVSFRNSGNVGIGTTNTQGFKLAVKGKIGAEEIQVHAPGYWPDYVFSTDYHLKPLNEVESFIEENNHLPDIPSEKEVKEKGINLGDMDAKLLQKIEELTLYMIEQNKETKSLKQENKELKNTVSELIERIKTLEDK